MVVLNILFICMVLSVLCFICSHTSQTALPCNLKISFFHLAATSKDMSEADSVLVAQNGTAITKKLPISLPELEYKEKGKDGGKDKKQQQQQNSIGINNNILQTVDAKLQDIEYMENHLNTKRLNNELGGSAENLFLKEEVGGGGGSSTTSKHYKNSSPHSHNSTNGSVPSSSSSRSEKKQKCAGKNLAPHRDLMENCIPNNQLSKPDALVR